MKKLLLDECVPHRARHSLPGFEVFTVAYMDWGGIKNGKLLQLASDNHFDIFLTTDKNIQFQQNPTKFDLSIVVFEAAKDDLDSFLLLVPKFIELSHSGLEKNRIYVVG